MLSDWGDILRRATFCGECRRNFEDCSGDHCYMRMGPGRGPYLVCHDCHLKDPPPPRDESPKDKV